MNIVDILMYMVLPFIAGVNLPLFFFTKHPMNLVAFFVAAGACIYGYMKGFSYYD